MLLFRGGIFPITKFYVPSMGVFMVGKLWAI